MTAQLNRTRILKFLEDILLTPSPSGFMNLITPVVTQHLEELGYSVEQDNKGNLIVHIKGLSSEKTLGLSAHLDTLGAMVRAIKDNGRIRLTSIGGYIFSTIEGEYCQIHTRNHQVYTGTVLTTSPSVHVHPDARTQERTEENMEVRVDALVSSREDIESLGIRVGDYISFDPRTAVLDNGFIKSRHLDDKAGIASIYAYLEYLSTSGAVPAYDLVILLSTYEEVGHGSAYIPPQVSELLAVDMGAIGSDLKGCEDKVSICAKDSSGPYDYHMTGKLMQLAESNAIDFTVDVFPFYSSDVSAALKGGNDIRGALIGPGVHASHGMERTHIKAIEATAKLLALYCHTTS